MAISLSTVVSRIRKSNGEQNMLNKRLLTALLFILVTAYMVAPAMAQDDLMGDFTVSHYFRRLRWRIHRRNRRRFYRCQSRFDPRRKPG